MRPVFDEPFSADLANTAYAPCDRDRFVLVAVPLDTIPFGQGGRQTSPTAAAARQYPYFHPFSDGKLRAANILDQLTAEPAAYYIMDPGYIDFQ